MVDFVHLEIKQQQKPSLSTDTEQMESNRLFLLIFHTEFIKCIQSLRFVVFALISFHWFPQVEFGYEMQGVTFYVHCCKQQQNLTLPTSLYFVELYGNILFYMVENNCYVHFYLYGFILPDVYHRSYL